MKKTITSILMLAATYCCQAQIAPSWVKYPAPADYANYDVKEVSSGVDTLGNIYTTASISDTVNNLSKVMLVKYNLTGTQQWIKYYDNNNASYNGTYAVSLLVDKAGNSYVCGYGVHNSTASKDIMVIKYDNAGNQQWLQYWDGGQNLADYATCATFDNSGNVVVGGYANNQGATGDDMAVVKWSPSGTSLGSYTYNNNFVNDEDRVLAVATDTNNNIFITGSSFGTSHRDFITLKLNSACSNVWTNVLPHVTNGDERGYSITTDKIGNSYVTGVSADWITMKFDPTGSIQWTNHYTLNSLEAYNLKKVMLDKFNNVIVTGDAGVSTANQSDLIVSKLNNANGNSMWTFSYNNAGIDDFTDAAVDTNGYVYVTGYFEGPLGTDMSTMILATNGTLLWHSTFSNPLRAAGGDQPYKIVLDKDRNVILSGTAETRGNNSNDAVDVITLKYNTSTTGIHELAVEKLDANIYPNPAKDKIFIGMGDKTLMNSILTIHTITGSLVKEEAIISSSQEINISNLDKGIYLLTIKNEKAIATKKLVIE